MSRQRGDEDDFSFQEWSRRQEQQHQQQGEGQEPGLWPLTLAYGTTSMAAAAAAGGGGGEGGGGEEAGEFQFGSARVDSDESAVANWRALLEAARSARGGRLREQVEGISLQLFDSVDSSGGAVLPAVGAADVAVGGGVTPFAGASVPAALDQDSRIGDYLAAATQLEAEAPDVSRILLDAAYKKAMQLDPNMKGRGVLQFVTMLSFLRTNANRGGQDDSADSQSARSDLQTMIEFYNEFFVKLEEMKRGPDSTRDDLGPVMKTAHALLEVISELRKANPTAAAELRKALSSNQPAEEEAPKEKPPNFNIVDLEAAVAYSGNSVLWRSRLRLSIQMLHDTRDLPKKNGRPFKDMLHFLQHAFGFQDDNVRNQREHIVMLLTNQQIPATADEEASFCSIAAAHLADKVLKNYRRWADYMHPTGAPLKPTAASSGESHELLFASLFLLIWGEAANLRFMPECLAFIFHHLALELREMLGNPTAVRSAAVPQDSPFAFLEAVVTPIYDVIAAESKFAGHGITAKGHHLWRSYDDLNEYFWSEKCLKMKWPLDTRHEFFQLPQPSRKEREEAAKSMPEAELPLAKTKKKKEAAGASRPKKTFFTEWRTFLHLFHSFHRLWIFLLLMLQAMVIIAFSGPGNGDTFLKVLTIAPTAAVLLFFQALLDVGLSLFAYRSMSFWMVLRKFLRCLTTATWAGFLVFFCVKALMNQYDTSNPYTRLFFVLVAAFWLPKFVLGILLRIAPLRKQVEKFGHHRVSQFVKWFFQEEFYVGRGMYESTKDTFIYSTFWVVLLICKFLFSYYFQVMPLVGGTRFIISFSQIKYKWHDVFSGSYYNFLTLVALWAPVVTIYLLDTQVWYTVMSALGGGVIGAWWHLGEIRSLHMLRHRFGRFPQAFCKRLLHSSAAGALPPPEAAQPSTNNSASPIDRDEARRFAVVWNEIVSLLRDEDYISNREKDILLMPRKQQVQSTVQWPLLLVASQIPLAVEEAKANQGSDKDLWSSLSNEYMKLAILEAYELLKPIVRDLIPAQNQAGEPSIERRLLVKVLDKFELAIQLKKFVSKFDLKKAPQLLQHLVKLTTLLVQDFTDAREIQAVHALQGLYKFIMTDFIDDPDAAIDIRRMEPPGHLLFSQIIWPPAGSQEQLLRLHLLLSMKESTRDVPLNLEARRRLQFFTNSLFMKMPKAPLVQHMMSFCVMTPYYSEIVAYSKNELVKPNVDGISTLFYLQKIFKDEWENFLERIGQTESEMESRLRAAEDSTVRELRLWASYRGQTLARTVRGMMYYRRALQLLAALERGRDIEAGKQEGDDAWGMDNRMFLMSEEESELADLKFTYVVTCQIYGEQRQKKDVRALDIFNLMKENKGLRVAYIDEVTHVDRDSDGKETSKKEYFSRLVKVDVFGQEQDIYKVKLPGPAKLGEGKPENQNHAIIFTRGEALQTIDMNQDNYFEEALKVRNLLEEFNSKHGLREPTILGVREHIFTGSVSSLAWFMSNQEASFVTLGQRFLAVPLKVRMHYGHPDIFDRLFHITRGGISKASKTINISEDIYAGFNSTLRQGNVTHHEYIQVGKGRDVGLNQIALFEAKVSSGNGEQVLSRDIFRLGNLFDFYRMLSFYFTSVGFYFCTMLTVLCAFFFLYGKVYMALSGVESALLTAANASGNEALTSAISTQFLIQLGIFTAVPMIMGFILEQGFLAAILSFVTMQLQLASVFFTFSLGTRTHYFARTLLHGGAKYRSTGRGFAVEHIKFADNYRLYSRSHFTAGLEVIMLLIVYMIYGSNTSTTTYLLITISSWFLAISWCWAPFLFNPAGFEWQKTVADFDDWTTWLWYRGGVGVKGEQSWESWWEEETEHVRSLRSRTFQFVLNLRFFLIHYGIVYSLNVAEGSTSIMVYAFSWIVLASLLLILWAVNIGSAAEAQLPVRLIQSVLFVASVGALIIVINVTPLSVSDVFACILGLIPTGWGILQMLIAFRPTGNQRWWYWQQVRTLARVFDATMGAIIFFPVALLSWFPFISTFQTRLLFNQAFSRGLEISLILAGKPNNEDGK